MSKTFEEMTKAELQKVAELYKVTDEINDKSKADAIAAEKPVPKVPSNDTYIAVLNAFKDKKAEDNPTDTNTGTTGNVVSSAGETIEVVKRRFARSKIPCIVTDHDNTRSTEEEIEGLTTPVRWGNKQGKRVSHIALHGRMQYVEQGAIDAMKYIKMPTNTKTKSTRTKLRFSVSLTEGWTEAQIEAKIQEQKTKQAV